jgi:MoaA/NifB/PqqE/SkfB family radical SAM enzyme
MNFSAEKIYSTALMKMVDLVITNDRFRESTLKFVEKKVYEKYVKVNATKRPVRAQMDKYMIISNMLRALAKSLQNKTITKQVRMGLLKSLGSNVFLGGLDKINEFNKKYGFLPPTFITISPAKFCNLKCKGCYAISSKASQEKLDYEVFDRIITEKTELWGSHFTVISGGEPFLYKIDGKTIIDLAREHSDNFFLVYTNGTVINERLAEKIAEIGNITPAISVEEFEEQTDARRGKGVHKKILQTFENLKKVGVPYGISITAMRYNAELVVSDEFIKYYFEEKGVVFAWIFQYMPIGRSFTLDLVVSPEQRVYMYHRTQELIRERGLFLVDFWNCGTISNGCISAGRGSGGYFYIDWNGNATPCVFNPYSTLNVIEVFKNGGNLNDIILSPFFKAIRKWQDEYSISCPITEVGNQIGQCGIRDHYTIMRKIIDEHNANPIDEASADALKDDDYYKGMIEYEKRLAELTDPIWEENYLEPERKRQAVKIS